jgi:hypothetical protein
LLRRSELGTTNAPGPSSWKHFDFMVVTIAARRWRWELGVEERDEGHDGVLDAALHRPHVDRREPPTGPRGPP